MRDMLRGDVMKTIYSVRKCVECREVLIDSMYFCDIECETNYRNDNQEFHAKMKDGSYEDICPVNSFMDDLDTNELVIDNGCWEYRFNKDDIDKWEIALCDCFIEFMDIVRWQDVN